jgi:hypothetical protein
MLQRMRFHQLLALLLIGLMSEEAIAVSAGTNLPQQAVQSFYAVYLKSHTTGLPDSKKLNQLKPYLSQHLVALILQAREEQQRYIKKYPDDKPPWIEGDLFSSLFEGPTACTVAAGAITSDRARVMVRFTYNDPKTPGRPFTWQDAVYLVKEHNTWVIDDIEYLGGWDFAPKGRLSESLKQKAGD